MKILSQNKVSLPILISVVVVILSIVSHSTFYANAAAAAVVNSTTDTVRSSSSSSSSYNSSGCNCVAFRVDDVSDNRIAGNLAVLNLFLSENQPLTLGIVMNHIGRSPILMDKIMEGTNKGLFELALHGYDHLNYVKLSGQEQMDQLSKANERMNDLFGKPSKIFVPPYDTFNNYTVNALSRLDIPIISAGDFEYSQNSQYHIFSTINPVAHDGKSNQVYHLARSTGIEDFGDNNLPIKLPLQTTLNRAYAAISKYGYAIIVMHPTSFLTMKNGKYTNIVDQNEINNVKTLINSIKSKNIHITSMSKIAGIS
jgi:peptidoglycan/xylan/chitin deacetylase (PgdA/CDA1 family)